MAALGSGLCLIEAHVHGAQELEAQQLEQRLERAARLGQPRQALANGGRAEGVGRWSVVHGREGLPQPQLQEEAGRRVIGTLVELAQPIGHEHILHRIVRHLGHVLWRQPVQGTSC